ncbi:MAG: AAA family ATPase [Coriobacteriales bacterium]|nr:AAA family ATPase [Coriobacteriales bacterium]
MPFWGRDNELKRLETFFAQDAQAVALVYGRRRVGKSELLKQSLRSLEIPAIYYECKRTTELNNLASLSALASDILGFPPLAFASIEDLLGFLFEQAISRSLVLVLDEYPFLREAVGGLDSILQSIIDRNMHDSHMKLVLCGSYINVMKSLLEEENPLYGRIDLTINLCPMNYRDSASFYPSFSLEDCVRLYSVFGGIPYYNRLISADKSVRQNIIDLIASPGARLENEVPMYLASQLRRIANANEVLETIAMGAVHFSDILSQSHVSSSPALADTLERLIGMELVEKVAPINDPNNRKKIRYRISDNMTLFYYRYVFRYASQLSVMAADTFYDQ